MGGCEGESMGVCGMVSCRSVYGRCGKQWEGERVYRSESVGGCVGVWESVWECGRVCGSVGECGRVCGSVGECVGEDGNMWESVCVEVCG